MATDNQNVGYSSDQYSSQDGENAPPQKLAGVFFWMTGGLAITKDLVIDTGADALVSAGIGIAGGGAAVSALTLGLSNLVTLPLGLSIAVLAWSAKMLFAVTIWLIMFVYFYLHGGIHTTVRIRRFVIWFLAIIIEIVPYVDILPATTVMFFLVAFMENAVRKNNLLGYAARTAVNAHSKKVRPGGIMPKLNYETT